MPKHKIVFLFDVDNTLLDNDRVTADLQRHHPTRSRRRQSAQIFPASLNSCQIYDIPPSQRGLTSTPPEIIPSGAAAGRAPQFPARARRSSVSKTTANNRRQTDSSADSRESPRQDTASRTAFSRARL